MLVSGAVVASTGTAIAAPPTNAKVATSPSPTPKHQKKCPVGQRYTKVNGKWGCHNR